MEDVTVKVVDEAATQALKSGWRTTEFWIALGMKLAGAYLISKGKDELGVVLIAAGGGGYLAGRTLVKRAPRIVSVLLLAFTLALAGCSCDRHLDVDNVGDLIEDVCDRHDAYVVTDTTLSPAERSTAQRSSQVLRLLVDEARKPVEVEAGD